MVAPFMVSLKKWIKRSRAKREVVSVSAASDEKSAVEPPVDLSLQASNDQDASEALMLLLGVNRVEAAPVTDNTPVQADNTPVNADNTPFNADHTTVNAKVDLLQLLRNGGSYSPAVRPSTPQDAIAIGRHNQPSSAATASGNLIQTIFSQSPSARATIPQPREESPRPWHAGLYGQPAPAAEAMPRPPPDLQALQRRLSGEPLSDLVPSKPSASAASLLAILQGPSVAMQSSPESHDPRQHQQQLLDLFGAPARRDDASMTLSQRPDHGPAQYHTAAPPAQQASRQDSLLALLNGPPRGTPPPSQQPPTTTTATDTSAAGEQKRRNDDFLLGYLNDAVRRM